MASDDKKTGAIFDCAGDIVGRIDIRKDIPADGFAFDPARFWAIFHARHNRQFEFKLTCTSV